MNSYRTWSTLSGFYSQASHDDSNSFFIFSTAMFAGLSCDVVSTYPWLPTRMVQITFSGYPPSYCTRSVVFRSYLGRELFRIAPSDARAPFFRHLFSSVQFSKQKSRGLSRAFSPVGNFFVFTVFCDALLRRSRVDRADMWTDRWIFCYCAYKDAMNEVFLIAELDFESKAPYMV
jgi:hypothetical protein